ncbi:MAG: hypothetical protein ACSNEK_08730 [Parachlamydiaceae bacterium]
MQFNPIIASVTSTLYYKNGELYQESKDDRINNICRRIFCRSCYNPNLILAQIQSKMASVPLTSEQRDLALNNYSKVINNADENLAKYQKDNFIIRIFKRIFFGRPQAIREDLRQYGNIEKILDNLEKFTQEEKAALSNIKQVLESLGKNNVAHKEKLFKVMDQVIPKLIDHAKRLDESDQEDEFDDLEAILSIIVPLLNASRFESQLQELKKQVERRVQSEFANYLEYDPEAAFTETDFYARLNIPYPSDLLAMINNDLPELLRREGDTPEIELYGVKRNNADNLQKILEHLNLFHIRDLQDKGIFSKTAFKDYLKTVNVAQLRMFIRNLE